jgi:hypothetical protein
VIAQRLDIAVRTGEKIIDAQDICSLGNQSLAKMRSQKAGSAGD